MKKTLSKPWLALVLLPLVTLVIYHNIYQCPFVFDDVRWIEKDLKIRSLSHYLSLEKLLKPRALAKLSLALNYKFGRLDVFGYHLVNVLIHMANGFLAYFLALTLFKQFSPSSTKPFDHLNGRKSKMKVAKSKERRQRAKTGRKQKSKKALPSGHNAHPAPSQSSPMNRDFRYAPTIIPDESGFPLCSNNHQSSIHWMSLFAALIFIAHPIQTQGVTYTVQRLASMAAMFYMAARLQWRHPSFLGGPKDQSRSSSGPLRPRKGFANEEEVFSRFAEPCCKVEKGSQEIFDQAKEQIDANSQPGWHVDQCSVTRLLTIS